MDDIVYGIIVAAIIAIVGYFAFRDMWDDMNNKLDELDAEDDEWYRKRAERQAEFDRHANAVARRELFDQAVSIHFAGENKK